MNQLTIDSAKKFITLFNLAKTREAAFKKMSKAAQRIAIAEDTIRAIDNGTINANGGSYILIETGDEDERELGDLRSVMLSNQIGDNEPVCTACALGSMFAAKVLLTNKVNVEDVSDERAYVVRGLRAYFSEDQLDLIESAYEGCSSGKLVNQEPSMYWRNATAVERKSWTKTQAEAVQLILKAEAFAQRHGNRPRRMKAIMRNIIRNGGTFVL